MRGPALTCCLRGVQGLALVGGPRAVGRRVSRRQAAQPGETRRTGRPGRRPPPRVTRPIWWETSCAYATGNAAQNPGPAATTSTTRWGWGRDTQPFGSRDKDKTENEMRTHVRAHTCTHTHTRRVLNQAAAGLTGQQRRRRQRKEPVSPRRRAAWEGVAASGGGESGRAGGRTTCRGVPRALGTNPWGTGDVHSSRKLGHALPRSPPTCGSLGDGDLVFRGDVPPPPPLQPARGSVSGTTGTPAPQGAQSTRPPPSPAVGPAGTGRLSARPPV